MGLPRLQMQLSWSWIPGFSMRDRPQMMLMGKLGTAGLGTGLEDAAGWQKGSAGMLQLLGLALIFRVQREKLTCQRCNRGGDSVDGAPGFPSCHL